MKRNYSIVFTRIVYTQVLAAKKDPKAKRLSDNVKKFLDRRKADEEAQRREAKRKKDELQQLRAESRESQKVVSNVPCPC